MNWQRANKKEKGKKKIVNERKENHNKQVMVLKIGISIKKRILWKAIIYLSGMTYLFLGVARWIRLNASF